MPVANPRASVALCLSAAMAAAPAAAFDFNGTKAVVATTASGDRVDLGTVHFTPAADGAVRFSLQWRGEVFSDHFLSMREFKCLQGRTELTCHVPYPYPQPGAVRAGDLAWLEHSLLFFFKAPADFGAKLWNGVYFELRSDGARLVGTPRAVDLNQIAAPPANPSVPPFRAAQRHEMSASSRWIRQISIE